MIQQIVNSAFKQAHSSVGQESSFADQSPGRRHSDRSRAFVANLAQELKNHYLKEPKVRVLSGSINEYRNEFGSNEVLFDITVVCTDTTESAHDRAKLTYVTENLWTVESEFARDSRKTLQDFNKLLLSNAKSKLFICTQVDDQARFLKPVATAASGCSGQLFVAAVPHPDTWLSQPARPVTFWDIENGEPVQTTTD